MPSVGNPSVLLWVASAFIAFLGARTYLEYLRRLHHEGPLRLWLELLLAALAFAATLWSAMIIDLGAQGLAFEIGYHPAKVFGSLGVTVLAVAAVIVLATIRQRWLLKLLAAPLAALAGLALQVAVIWSIGAEPGLAWRSEPLFFAVLLLIIGVVFSGQMVLGARRGSRADRPSRRLMAALVLGACVVAAQELVISASGLERQVVSAHARFLPEMLITLVAGAGVPIGLVLLLVDQRSQQRARASERRRKSRRRVEGTETGNGALLPPDSQHAAPPR